MCATKSAGFFKIAYYYTFFALGYIAENYKSDNSIDSEVFKHLLKFTI